MVRVQREKIQSGWKKDKRFEGEGGAGALHWQRGSQMGLLSIGGIKTGGVRGGRHSAGRCGISRKSRDAAGKEAPGVRAAKSSESRKGK